MTQRQLQSQRSSQALMRQATQAQLQLRQDSKGAPVQRSDSSAAALLGLAQSHNQPPSLQRQMQPQQRKLKSKLNWGSGAVQEPQHDEHMVVTRHGAGEGFGGLALRSEPHAPRAATVVVPAVGDRTAVTPVSGLLSS